MHARDLRVLRVQLPTNGGTRLTKKARVEIQRPTRTAAYARRPHQSVMAVYI